MLGQIRTSPRFVSDSSRAGTKRAWSPPVYCIARRAAEIIPARIVHGVPGTRPVNDPAKVNMEERGMGDFRPVQPPEALEAEVRTAAERNPNHRGGLPNPAARESVVIPGEAQRSTTSDAGLTRQRRGAAATCWLPPPVNPLERIPTRPGRRRPFRTPLRTSACGSPCPAGTRFGCPSRGS